MVPIKIVLAEPYNLFCQSLVALLRSETSVHICTAAPDAGTLLLAVEHHCPDVVLVAARLPGLDGCSTLQALRLLCPATILLVLASPGDDDIIRTLVKEGAGGFICRQKASGDELVQAIHHVHAGRSWLPRLLELPATHKFNPKEIEIMRHICSEKPTKQIAALVGLRPRTVEAYRRRIMEKTSAQSRVGIVLYAVKHGIFKV
jgi:DNA-binding NarL/FixJ family response regulator